MKRIATIFLMMLFTAFMSFPAIGSGRKSRITYGAEWNCMAYIMEGEHHNFYAEEGYRIDINECVIGFRSNAEFSVHVGYQIEERWNISLYMGYAGIADIHHAVPVSIRATRYFEEKSNHDRWFAFADLGSGFSIKTKPQEILQGKLGAGYRLSLSPKIGLDFIAAMRIIYTHSDVHYYGFPVETEKINRNNAYLSGISIGIGLSF